MDEIPNIPSWIAKTSVPETKETTEQLLETWSKLIDAKEPSINVELDDEAFIKEACHIANQLEKKFHKKHSDFKRANFGIWVGFPETPIGRLNAQLASRVYFVHHWLTQKIK